MITLGIDPGLTGAIAVIGDGDHALVYPMPVVQVGKTGFVKNAVDIHALARLLAPYRERSRVMDVTVVIERVNAFPGQGVSSMFSLGMSYWGAAGVVAGLGLPLHVIESKAWKRFFHIDGPKDGQKELARGLASRLFPGVDLSKKKDHGKADALLIARYGHVNGGML